MLKKAFISMLCGLLCAFVMFTATAQAAEYSLSDLSVCKRVFACGNAAAYFYGYTNTALISSRVSDGCRTSRVDVDGVIRAVTHSGSFTYALLSVRSRQYSILRLNAENGSYSIFDLKTDSDIDPDSIAADNEAVYLMTLTGSRREAAGFDFSGNKTASYSLSNGVAGLFSNGSNAYALSLGGEIFRLDGSIAVHCANAACNAQICDAGDGYIFTDGRLVSLSDGSSTACSARLAAMGQNGAVTSDSGMLMTAANGRIYLLNSDFICAESDETSAAAQSDSGSLRTWSELTINGETTVSQLKNMYPDIKNVYDDNGGEVTRGKLRTGYRADSACIVILGDLDGSGTISSSDMKLLMEYQIGKAQLSGAFLKAADYNSDGTVDNRDLVLISKNK